MGNSRKERKRRQYLFNLYCKTSKREWCSQPKYLSCFTEHCASIMKETVCRNCSNYVGEKK